VDDDPDADSVVVVVVVVVATFEIISFVRLSFFLQLLYCTTK
jgi:hypothetical protein